jgi:hypothetical protein
MFQPDLSREDSYRFGRATIDRISSSRDKQNPTVEALPDINELLPKDLSPNKKAVIETLVTLWEAKYKS